MRTLWLVTALAVTVTASAEPTRCPAGMTLVTERQPDGTERAACVIDVLGSVARPYPFSVVGRSGAGYVPAEPARSFVPDVTASVRRAPF